MTVERKVAYITGIARGQGRAHAVKLASVGWDIVGVDICEDIATMDYPNASEADLDETIALVEKEGASIVAEREWTCARYRRSPAACKAAAASAICSRTMERSPTLR